MEPPASPPPLEVYLLGMVDFDDVQRLQRRLVYDLGERGGGGPWSSASTRRRSASAARAAGPTSGPTTRSCARWASPSAGSTAGGGCVLHLPGQLAGYLAPAPGRLGLDLRRLSRRAARRVLVEVLAEFDLAGATRPGRPGVFLGNARVATVGVAVEPLDRLSRVDPERRRPTWSRSG